MINWRSAIDCWMNAMSCARIVDEIQENIDLLATQFRDLPQRHRSIRAVFDQSWQMLSDEERGVMERFAVFRGGCTHEAAEAVAGASWPVLAALVDKSLLWRDSRTDRYQIQELLRQYAEEQLDTSGSTTTACDAHLSYYAGLFCDVHDVLFSPQGDAMRGAIVADFENLRAAWDWALAQERFQDLDMMLDVIWTAGINLNRHFEARALFAAARDKLEDAKGEERAIFGRVLARLGKCESVFMRHDKAEAAFLQSLAIARECNSLFDIAYVLSWLARLMLNKGDSASARTMLEETGEIYRTLDIKFGMALTFRNLATTLGLEGEVERCQDLHLKSLGLFHEMGDKLHYAETLHTIGVWRLRWGEWDQTRQDIAEAVSVFNECQHPTGSAQAISHLSQIMLASGELEEAQQMAATTLTFAQDVQDTFYGVMVSAASLFTLSHLAGLNEDYAEAYQLAKKAMDFALLRPHTILDTTAASLALGWSLWGLERYDEAADCLAEFLFQARDTHASAYMVCGLAVLAAVYFQRGETARAAELVGLVSTHSASPTGFLERHPLFGQLKDQMKSALGAERYLAMVTRGSQQDLEDCVTAVLSEMQADIADPIAQANQSLPDPLTPRELEVLALLAKRLSNPQIAERLFISTGTVKGHVNKILQKLNAKDRQEAAERAQTLQLLNP